MTDFQYGQTWRLERTETIDGVIEGVREDSVMLTDVNGRKHVFDIEPNNATQANPWIYVWTKLSEVPEPAELSIVMDREGHAWQRHGLSWWRSDTYPLEYDWAGLLEDYGPINLLVKR